MRIALIICCLAFTECHAEESLEALLQQAAQSQSRGDEEGLLALALKGVSMFPGEKRFYLTAGTYAGRRRQFDRAVEVLEKGVQRWRDDAKLRSLLGSAHFGRGTEALDRGDTGAAIRDLEQASELLPEDKEILLNLGRAQHNALRYSEAAETFGRLLRQDPEFPLARFHRATSRLALGQTLEAIADLPGELDYAPACLVRGLAYLTQGESTAALKDLEKAAKTMPESAAAQDGYARALLRFDRFAEAEPLLREAMKLDENDPGPVNTLVGVLYRLGRGEEAKGLRQHAAELAKKRRSEMP